MTGKIELDILQVAIIDPNRIIYEGQAKRVFAPGRVADLAFLPQHTPLYTELIKGMVIIEDLSGNRTEKKIDGGVARLKNNQLTILIGF